MACTKPRSRSRMQPSAPLTSAGNTGGPAGSPKEGDYHRSVDTAGPDMDVGGDHRGEVSPADLEADRVAPGAHKRPSAAVQVGRRYLVGAQQPSPELPRNPQVPAAAVELTADCAGGEIGRVDVGVIGAGVSG